MIGLATWKQLKPGDVVVLKDALTLQQMLAAKRGLTGAERIINRVHDVSELNNICQWRMFFCDEDGDDPAVVVMVKIVDENFDVRLYYPTDLEPGNRQDMIDREFFWMFEDPGVPDPQPTQLHYTAEMTADDNLPYARKEPGEWQGSARFSPRNSGDLDRYQVTLVEYSTDKPECTEPELLLYEVGKPGLAEGGLVTLYKGITLQGNDMEVLRCAAGIN